MGKSAAYFGSGWTAVVIVLASSAARLSSSTVFSAPPDAAPTSAGGGSTPVSTASSPERPLWRAFKSGRPPFLAHVGLNHADGVYMEGDKLAVEFKAERTARLYLLYHQADGTSLLLFPNSARLANEITAGETVRVPGKGDPFRFRVRPPFGEETLQVLAAVKPIDELDQAVPRPGDAPIISQEVLERLRRRLADDDGSWTEARSVLRTTSDKPPTSPPQRASLSIGVHLRRGSPKPHNNDRIMEVSARRMHAAFTSYCGVSADRARLLTGSDAARDAIESAITEWLPSVTRPGDTVLIFYNGHGGKVPNRDGTEPDMYDEFLTTYDTPHEPVDTVEEWVVRAHRQGIVDDALARWLQALPGRQVVLLMETCHGGGLVDAKRFATLFGDEAARIKDVSNLGTIVVTACMPDESSYFDPQLIDQGAFMPRLLINAMEKLPPPVSVRQAYDYYRANIESFLREVVRDRWHATQMPLYTDNSLFPVELVPSKPQGGR